MSASVKHIVFDWNGTLLDDLQQSLAGFNAVLRLFGVPEFSEDRYQQSYTVPFIRLYEHADCDPAQLVAREHEIHNVFHSTYDEAVKTANLRQGAESLLDLLRLRNAHIVVLSNHTVMDIERQAKRLGIFPFFDAILANGSNGVAYTKRGKDQRLKEYMSVHSLEGGYIVGDSVEEIEIGRDFGLTSIALTGGMCSETRLRAENPDHLIHSLHELKPILQDRGFVS